MLPSSEQASGPIDKPTPERVACKSSFPWRGLLLGLAGLPPLIFWGAYSEIVASSADLVALSLPIVTFAPLLLLVGVNRILHRYFSHLALAPSDILFAYALHLATITVSGMGMMPYLVSFLAGARRFGTDASAHLRPTWALPSPEVITPFYEGHSSVFHAAILNGWQRPILFWSAFLLTMLAWMFFTATFLQRQWAERKRLLFPMVMIPLEATSPIGANAERGKPNGLFWIGFLFAAVLESLAAIHYSLDPRVPYFPVKFDEPSLQIGGMAMTPPGTPWANFRLVFTPLSLVWAICCRSILAPLNDDFRTGLGYFYERSLSRLAQRMAQLPERLASGKTTGSTIPWNWP